MTVHVLDPYTYTMTVHVLDPYTYTMTVHVLDPYTYTMTVHVLFLNNVISKQFLVIMYYDVQYYFCAKSMCLSFTHKTCNINEAGNVFEAPGFIFIYEN